MSQNTTQTGQRFNPQIKKIMDDMLLVIPGVSEGKLFGYPAYTIKGKAFAVLCGAGVAFKLSEQVAEEMIRDDYITYFEPVEGKIWRAWILVEYPRVDQYRMQKPLYERAMRFTLGE
ncbi:MAG: hypothetical protein GYB67_06605 [Chloroflexi bacterium]|nr:hypothetical protein [Chloroflexota bacterium]